MHEFGVHVSIAGGIDKAPERAKELGCDTFQLFISNPRSWKEPVITVEQAALFKEKTKQLKLKPVTVHATYLPNPANPDKEQFEKSVNHLKMQYKASNSINADFFVLHPGSHKKSGLTNGINQISKALNHIIRDVPQGPVLLLENTAGGGDTIGKNAQELIQLIHSSKLPERKIGICLDSCHAFASGIDVSNPKILKNYCEKLQQELFNDVIRLIHLNDSKFYCGENKDRHEHIGLGKIGNKGISNFLNLDILKDLPVILETPVNETRSDQDNLHAARKLSADI